MELNNNNKSIEYNTQYQFPYYLLLQILNHIVEDIDKVCFIGTCKKIYQCGRFLLKPKNRSTSIPPPKNKFNIQLQQQQQQIQLEQLPILIKNLIIISKPDQPQYKLSLIGQGELQYSFNLLATNIDPDRLPSLSKISNVLTHLKFSECFKNPILFPGFIPQTITHLSLGDLYTHPLKPGVIPKSVTNLTLGRHYNHPLEKDVIPSSVITLSFGDYYTTFIPPGVIPSSVKRLKLGKLFNQPIEIGTIPESVIHLSFGTLFNQTLKKGTIPEGCITVLFGENYNKPLQFGTIPSSVKKLVFGLLFDQPISPSLIPSVTNLKFDTWFQQPLNSQTLPSSVSHLTLSPFYRHDLTQLPPSITHLTFNSIATNFEIKEIATSVTHLSFRKSSIFLSNSILMEILKLIPSGFKKLDLFDSTVVIQRYNQDYNIISNKFCQGGIYSNGLNHDILSQRIIKLIY
eukprot:gene9207-11283_t